MHLQYEPDFLEKIDKFVTEGLSVVNEGSMDMWGARVTSFLNVAFGHEVVLTEKARLRPMV